jgi:dihydroxyacetone kinase-like protein
MSNSNGAELDQGTIRSFLINLSTAIMSKKEELNRLDAACGDGDLGSGLYRGFNELRKALEEKSYDDVGDTLASAGNVIMSTVGGTAGPLFGTLLIEVGKASRGKAAVNVAELASVFEAALQKVKLRGGSKVGDKTMIDALEPAVLSLREAANNSATILKALEGAAKAADAGYESTVALAAKHGKAKYLGDQSIGNADPGARVISLLFESLLNAYSQSRW